MSIWSAKLSLVIFVEELCEFVIAKDVFQIIEFGYWIGFSLAIGANTQLISFVRTEIEILSQELRWALKILQQTKQIWLNLHVFQEFVVDTASVSRTFWFALNVPIEQ